MLFNHKGKPTKASPRASALLTAKGGPGLARGDAVFVALGAEHRASQSTYTPPAPAGIQIGDLAIITITRNGAATAMSTPAGWTKLIEQANALGGASRFGVFYRFWQAEDSAPTSNTNYTSNFCTRMTAYRGIDTDSPFAATAISSVEGLHGAGNTEALCPSVVAAHNSSLLICFASGGQTVNFPSATTAEPAGMSNDWNDGSYSGMSHCEASQAGITAGATGTRNWTGLTSDSGSAKWTMYSMVLSPAIA
jgi:hypothetical protein